MRENGAEVIECSSRRPSWLKYLELVRRYWKIRNQFQIMVVGFPGQTIVPLAKLLCSKPIVFDALISLYDTYVFDRKTAAPRSLKAGYYWFLDWLSCKLADRVILDTQEHIIFFSQMFKIKPVKFFCSFVGSDDRLFYPRAVVKDTDKFLVYFYGTYIPLQGIKYIIEAASILKNEDILFRITTSKRGYQELKKETADLKLNNVDLISFVPVEKLPEYIAQADVCLGIFGDTDKAKRVVPTKLYDYIAMKKAVITAKTPAIQEEFRDGQELAFCQIANGQSLADKVLELKNNPALREKLALNSYRLYQEKFSPKAIGLRLLNDLKSCLNQER